MPASRPAFRKPRAPGLLPVDIPPNTGDVGMERLDAESSKVHREVCSNDRLQYPTESCCLTAFDEHVPPAMSRRSIVQNDGSTRTRSKSTGSAALKSSNKKTQSNHESAVVTNYQQDSKFNGRGLYQHKRRHVSESDGEIPDMKKGNSRQILENSSVKDVEINDSIQVKKVDSLQTSCSFTSLRSAADSQVQHSLSASDHSEFVQSYSSSKNGLTSDINCKLVNMIHPAGKTTSRKRNCLPTSSILSSEPSYPELPTVTAGQLNLAVDSTDNGCMLLNETVALNRQVVELRQSLTDTLNDIVFSPAFEKASKRQRFLNDELAAIVVDGIMQSESDSLDLINGCGPSTSELTLASDGNAVTSSDSNIHLSAYNVTASNSELLLSSNNATTLSSPEKSKDRHRDMTTNLSDSVTRIRLSGRPRRQCHSDLLPLLMYCSSEQTYSSVGDQLQDAPGKVSGLVKIEVNDPQQEENGNVAVLDPREEYLTGNSCQLPMVVYKERSMTVRRRRATCSEMKSDTDGLAVSSHPNTRKSACKRRLSCSCCIDEPKPTTVAKPAVTVGRRRHSTETIVLSATELPLHSPSGIYPTTSSCWQLGDLLWAATSKKSPMWPCMVERDPITQVFSKPHKSTGHLEYHIVYFGCNKSRGWIKEQSALPFEGLESFERLRASGKSDLLRQQRHKVRQTIQQKLKDGIEEAERAFLLKPNERIEKFGLWAVVKSGMEISASVTHSETVSDRSVDIPEGPAHKRQRRSSSVKTKLSKRGKETLSQNASAAVCRLDSAAQLSRETELCETTSRMELDDNPAENGQPDEADEDIWIDLTEEDMSMTDSQLELPGTIDHVEVPEDASPARTKRSNRRSGSTQHSVIAGSTTLGNCRKSVRVQHSLEGSSFGFLSAPLHSSSVGNVTDLEETPKKQPGNEPEQPQPAVVKIHIDFPEALVVDVEGDVEGNLSVATSGINQISNPEVKTLQSAVRTRSAKNKKSLADVNCRADSDSQERQSLRSSESDGSRLTSSAKSVQKRWPRNVKTPAVETPCSARHSMNTNVRLAETGSSPCTPGRKTRQRNKENISVDEVPSTKQTSLAATMASGNENEPSLGLNELEKPVANDQVITSAGMEPSAALHSGLSTAPPTSMQFFKTFEERFMTSLPTSSPDKDVAYCFRRRSVKPREAESETALETQSVESPILPPVECLTMEPSSISATQAGKVGSSKSRKSLASLGRLQSTSHVQQLTPDKRRQKLQILTPKNGCWSTGKITSKSTSTAVQRRISLGNALASSQRKVVHGLPDDELEKSRRSAGSVTCQKRKTKSLLTPTGCDKLKSKACSGGGGSEDIVNTSDIVDEQSVESSTENYNCEILRLTASSVGNKQTICVACFSPHDDGTDEFLSCIGACQRSFHRKCVDSLLTRTRNANTFTCQDCSTDVHRCFVCNVVDTNTKRCSRHNCHRFYHVSCARSLLLAHVDGAERIRCPLHVCASCSADDKLNPVASQGRMLTCIRCPTAYHVGDYCVPAGSQVIGGSYIVCTQHLSADTTSVNVNWCFLCSEGGMLVCCDSCPAAFHASCLKSPPPLEGIKWECEECVDGKRPLYGDIVWAKCGSYRWWPGEVYHPRHVPESLMLKPHKDGEFPLRFFGSYDFCWSARGRVYPFQEGDKGSKSFGRKALTAAFSQAINEANEAVLVWTTHREERDGRLKAKTDRKPPPYNHIKVNMPVGNVARNFRANPDDWPQCLCDPSSTDPCGVDSECINRILMYECHPSTCPAGERCGNQLIQRRIYPKLVPFRTPNRGWGLKALVDIKQGHFVIEYVGELIDDDECKRRMREAHAKNDRCYYMLTLDSKRIIDAGPKGNLARFINHSCQPNCESQKWNVNGDVKVGIFSRQDIPAGTELTFNYLLDCLGNEKTACQCGAALCSGFLGEKPKTNALKLPKDKQMKKRKAKRRESKPKSDGDAHEDQCFRCGGDGELVMCDKPGCPKAYHLDCLKFQQPPSGKWFCPWHLCDDCGKAATLLCRLCDDSYCSRHGDGQIFRQPDGSYVCFDHEKDELENVGITLPLTSQSHDVTQEV